ncbi:MAG: LamG domain-containing protein, partial [bacterium]|nr:LamG domain-containing protein [bacterium]
MSLIAQYLFNDNANDETGNYNGTPSNLTYESKPINYRFDGKAVSFNGNNSKIDLPNIPAIIGSNSRSIEFWRYKNQIVGNEFSSGSGDFYSFNTSTDSRGDFIDLSMSAVFFKTTVNLNKWEYVTIIYTGNSNIEYGVNYYINGRKIDATSTYNPKVANTTNACFAIGYIRSSAGHFFSGKLANFRIYDSVLTAEEVAKHYNAEKPLQPQVQFRPDDTGKWRKRFGGGSAQTTVDSDALIPNVYTALPSCSVGNRPELEVADGLYLLHQTRASDNDSSDVNWELNRVVDGVWQYDLTRDYITDSSGTNKAQAIKAATYRDLTIDANKVLSTTAWNGNTGGVGVIFVKGTLTINGTLSASGKGFVGGAGDIYNAAFGECYAAASINADSANPSKTSYAAGGGGMGNNGNGWSESSGGGGGHATVGAAGAKALLVANPDSRDGYAGVAGATCGQADLKRLYLGAG